MTPADGTVALAGTPGCPSGLEPAAADADQAVDPAPYVRIDGEKASLELAVFGAKCGGCIAKIEKAMAALPEMEAARLNLSTGRLTLRWRAGAFAPREIPSRLAALGYRAAPFDPRAVEAESDAEGRRLLRALAVAGFAMANVMLLSVSVWAGGAEMGEGVRGLMHAASAVIAAPAAIYAGRPFFSSALGALRAGRANMDVPISLAVILSLGVSFYEFLHGGVHTYFDAAVMLLFFLLIGRYLDHRLRLRARAAARDLLAMQATVANRLSADGAVEAVASRDLAPGDVVLIFPGDRAPVDGVVTEGSSQVDASLVTGESAPRRAGPGDRLHAGVLNVSQRLVMKAEKTADASLIADLARLIEAGEQSKSRYVRLADRAAALYVPIVHSLALATFAGWFFIVDAGLRASVMNAVAVLIITCPCALGLAAPAVQVVATGRLFRAGVLVKSGDALERLAEVDAVVFDKTGTLTYGAPRLANRTQISEATLADAAALARISRHPLSRAIVAAVGPGVAAGDAVETPGAGIAGTVRGRATRLGSAAFVGSVPGVGASAAGASGLSDVWLRVEGEPAQRFAFEDAVRGDAAETVQSLKGRGLGVELLSGDAPAVARKVAAQLGVEDWRAGQQPQDKIARLEALRGAGVRVAMVGDGLNDAPALAGAHASLSPAAAADASQAAADFVYQGEGLAPIVEAVDVARAARRRVLENFAFAALYNIAAVPLAAFGFVTPLIAALAMSGSSMVVTLNALRLSGRRVRKPAGDKANQGARATARVAS